ncbi:methanogen output domain 1-containing protein [Methanolobus sediminis]|uniref:Methanogen output domain 1-containing protein n=1 Tax=Methanolobus sediminis TaxID=3072978 RepID=A0AA51YIJ9_9EURY|nr:methanogen output domain 1-containing protein [Methanolobus sediminis]WMW24610.1 methanogen output domain 1-containing protein [Methanolobus sediminis]
MNIELLKAYLDDAYSVISATNGRDALDLVPTEKPDVILLDVMMPDLNGYQVCEALKSDPETQFIPVIMVTALSGRDDWIAGIEAGADEFLTKPVNKMELLTRITSLLKLKKMHYDLLEERDKLNLQNKIRSVLTQIIPTLLRTLPAEQKSVVIHQMIDMVVEAILENTDPEERGDRHEGIGEICCNIINQLGANFDDEPGENENTVFLIKGHVCPWGKEEAQLNPILCTLSRGIFSRIIDIYGQDLEVDVLETMGNGDEQCLFQLNKIEY